MVGDRLSDAEPALALGGHGLVIASAESPEDAVRARAKGIDVAPDFAAAVRIIGCTREVIGITNGRRRGAVLRPVSAAIYSPSRSLLRGVRRLQPKVSRRNVDMSLRHGAAAGRTLAVLVVLAAALALPARAQQQIPIGTSVTGQLLLSDPVMADQTHYKMFTFMGTAGQSVQIDLMSADFDAYLYLKDQNGQTLAHDDDSGGGHNSRIVQTLPYTGVYQVYANTLSRGETGSFTLQLRAASAQVAQRGRACRSRSRSARRSRAS